MTHHLLEVRDSTGQDKNWKIVITDVFGINQRILQGIHSVLYAGHLGYQKTLKKLQENFYWPDRTLDVRDFVLSCDVYHQQKSLHRLPVGLLKPQTWPEQRWAGVSLDFIMGLPRSEERYDGILRVVDRVTKMVHLVAMNQTIIAA